MNKGSITLGVIGTNFVADWLCETVQICPGIVTEAVYSRAEETGRAFAARHEIPQVYTDMEAFLSSPIDAVYIASPNLFHFPQAMAAVEHGLHVLVEKPACLNAAQWDALTRAADKAGVAVMEAMRPGHDPAMETAREAIGSIGTIRRAVFDFCQYSSRYDRFRRGEVLNAFNPALGNAALMDIGCYAVHCCVMLFGAPAAVHAHSVLLSNGMEGMGTAFLSYPGMEAEIVWSKITDSVNPSSVIGEDGALLFGKLSTVEWLRRVPRDGEPENITPSRPENNMIYEVSDFVDAVRGNATEKSLSLWREDTALTLSVMDEVRRQGCIVFPGE